MGLFDKFTKLAAERASLCDSQIHPFGIRIDEMYSPTEGLIQGKRVILAGTNNYLGLTFDPASIKAAQRSLELEGTGTTGSRMANGSYAGHGALEEELVDFLGRRSVIVFSTGYVANLAVIGTLAGSREVVLLDADCHASIYDACKLGGAEVIRFRHNDAADLERRMVRLGERAREAIILVEGIYSMLGDQAPLREIVEVKRRLGGYLLVDEAHSFGVLGANGRGLAEELDVDSEVDILLGTFSKSLGAVGGFAACHDAQMDLLRYASRPYIFTASPSPSAIASVRSALLAIRNRPQLRSQLWSNARRLYQGLQASGYQLGPQVSPVIAVMLKSPHEGLALWRALMERGVYVNLVLPPATPGAITLVRCSVSAAHSFGQIDHIIGAFASLRDPTGPVVADA